MQMFDSRVESADNDMLPNRSELNGDDFSVTRSDVVSRGQCVIIENNLLEGRYSITIRSVTSKKGKFSASIYVTHGEATTFEANVELMGKGLTLIPNPENERKHKYSGVFVVKREHEPSKCRVVVDNPKESRLSKAKFIMEIVRLGSYTPVIPKHQGLKAIDPDYFTPKITIKTRYMNQTRKFTIRQDASWHKFIEEINNAYGPNRWIYQYRDKSNDLIDLRSQSNFSVMLEEFKGSDEIEIFLNVENANDVVLHSELSPPGYEGDSVFSDNNRLLSKSVPITPTKDETGTVKRTHSGNFAGQSILSNSPSMYNNIGSFTLSNQERSFTTPNIASAHSFRRRSDNNRGVARTLSLTNASPGTGSSMSDHHSSSGNSSLATSPVSPLSPALAGLSSSVPSKSSSSGLHQRTFSQPFSPSTSSDHSCGERERERERVRKSSVAASPSNQRTFKWKKANLLGAGAFGKVYLGMDQHGSLLAIKQMELAGRMNSEMVMKMEAEINLMKKFSHPNIVRYIGMQRTNDFLYIFLEYVPGGSVQSLLEKFGKFPESVVSAYTKQVLTGLQYLHENHVLHRDIKGANLLVDEMGTVKLADFGSAKAIADGGNSMNRSVAGTPAFMAPETIIQGKYTSASDVWSLGCTVLEMLTGKSPWADMNFENHITALYQIANAKEGPKIPEFLSPIARNFVEICLKRNPAERASVEELLAHPFVTVNEDELAFVDDEFYEDDYYEDDLEFEQQPQRHNGNGGGVEFPPMLECEDSDEEVTCYDTATSSSSEGEEEEDNDNDNYDNDTNNNNADKTEQSTIATTSNINNDPSPAPNADGGTDSERQERLLKDVVGAFVRNRERNKLKKQAPSHKSMRVPHGGGNGSPAAAITGGGAPPAVPRTPRSALSPTIINYLRKKAQIQRQKIEQQTTATATATATATDRSSLSSDVLSSSPTMQPPTPSISSTSNNNNNNNDNSNGTEDQGPAAQQGQP